MEREIDTVLLDNNKEYAIVNEKNNYMYLVNIKDSKDVFIRKVVIDDGKECLIPLESDEEYQKALAMFNE